jgi:hypothetical protein
MQAWGTVERFASSLALAEPEDHVFTQVFQVNALVFVPLFLSEYVGSARMIYRPFSIGHCEVCG